MVSSNANSVAQRFKFNGQEYSEELGLNTYDFGARNYDPALGRWFSIDPLAEEREWLSPYNFVQNNPINRIDPDGALDEYVQGPLTDIWKLYKNEDGTYRAYKTHINDGKDDQIYLVMGDKSPTATKMYQGKEAGLEMSKDGVKISEYKNGSTFSNVKKATVDFWTSNEYRTKNARETMVNYVTSVTPAEGFLFGMLGKATKGSKLVDDAVMQAKKWLGKGYKPITNKAGDHIFMSKDKLRKIRFDIKNSQGDKPHIHLETFRNGKWRDAIKGSHRTNLPKTIDSMLYRTYRAKHNSLSFKIEEDNPEVGVYLYVFSDDKCVKDYLQNDIKTCKEIALEEYGVPFCSWESTETIA